MYGVNRGIKSDIPGLYLMQALWDVGPSRHEAAGEMPISWQELGAYASATGQISEVWELRAVMSMSKAYVTEKAEAAKDALRIPPVEREAMNG